jgi:hypothetical protein
LIGYSREERSLLISVVYFSRTPGTLSYAFYCWFTAVLTSRERHPPPLQTRDLRQNSMISRRNFECHDRKIVIATGICSFSDKHKQTSNFKTGVKSKPRSRNKRYQEWNTTFNCICIYLLYSKIPVSSLREFKSLVCGSFILYLRVIPGLFPSKIFRKSSFPLPSHVATHNKPHTHTITQSSSSSLSFLPPFDQIIHLHLKQSNSKCQINL